MKEKFLKMTGVFFLVAMMAVMLTPAPSMAVTTLTGFTAYTTTPGSTSGTISANDYVTINVNNDNGVVGAFVVNYANPVGSPTTLINATATTTTLGSTTVDITNNATVGGTLGVTGVTTLTGTLNANGTTNNIGTTSAATVNTIGSLNYSSNRLNGDNNVITASDENDIIATNGNYIRGATHINTYSGDGLTTIGNDINGLQVYGGATVTGGLTSNSGNVFLQTTAAGNPLNTAGNAYLDLTGGSNATLIYINSSDPLISASYQATDTRLLARYVTGSSFSDFFADANGVEATYSNTTSGNHGGLVVTDATTATTTVTGGSGAVWSTLSLDAAKASLVTADGSGVTINNDGTVSVLNSADNGGHGLTIYTDHTVLSGGGGTGGSPTSSSLTLADNAATLAVGTASSPEIQVLQATNNGSTTAVTIGGSSNRENDILATAANGVNYITANTTNGSNIIEANINTITGTTRSTITGGGNAGVNLVHNSASMGVEGGSAFTATNNQLTALTDDGSGLTVNNGVTAPGATAVSLLNSTGHGLTINTDSTVLSGGTTSTSLTLNNYGATFSNNGIPARVTGVADGENQYDAVNYGQMQKAYSGIASVSALAAIPGTMPGKKFAIGAGYGYFEHESAVAVGLKASLFDRLSLTAGVGFDVGNGSSSTASANAGFSYSF
jgi:hypothetical protein